ncbi:claudin-14-like [Scyliorhinus canicula]|uniref:claudin-14-like n=1 Tax=Scyliorhinus canicula TaxID=7830 RepID=UPI0018F3A2D5|nr:claudin-14-like [Scyliorhinus canicula]XP_038657147.1 claudin-14-like [Scyliorhinus canicula]
MAHMGIQIIGFFLGLFGLFGTLVATVLPHWRRTAHVGADIIMAMEFMKGLWMECVWQSTGIYQCQVHRSQLALPPDLQAARAMMVISCLLSALATCISIMGMKCTVCLKESSSKNNIAVSGGICYILAAIMCLIPVSWSTNDLIRDFYNPMIPPGTKYEMGEALYIGFMSTSMLLIGGTLLCLSCPQQRNGWPYQPRASFVQTAPQCRPPAVCMGSPTSQPSASHSSYRLHDYV